ncbi:hypothetical protein AB4Y63_17035 [Leifsonia sp. YAF41]|uniref:hypothetical protein n=1 Tax=Leifsonia sp. YAF41 TaxID=3233086 RepID=UPI003F9C7D2B
MMSNAEAAETYIAAVCPAADETQKLITATVAKDFPAIQTITANLADLTASGSQTLSAAEWPTEVADDVATIAASLTEQSIYWVSISKSESFETSMELPAPDLNDGFNDASVRVPSALGIPTDCGG